MGGGEQEIKRIKKEGVTIGDLVIISIFSPIVLTGLILIGILWLCTKLSDKIMNIHISGKTGVKP